MKILVLEVPATNLGYLGFYGNEWVATPSLDRLASQSVVFDRHYAGGDLASGQYRFPFADGARALEPIALADFWRDFPEIAFRHVAVARVSFRRAAKQVAKALASADQERTLVWAELPSLAPPWTLPDEMLSAYFEDDAEEGPWPEPTCGILAERENWLERLQNTYAAVVTFADAQVGEILEACADDWLVRFTSSTGLPLGEHGLVGPERAWQHEEAVHLPLVLRLPGSAEAGLRVGALTQPADIAPTLLEAFGLPAQGQGQSLWPLVRGQSSALRPFACSGSAIEGSVEWSLRTLDWAYLLPIAVPAKDPPRSPQLYVKPDDRWEVNDVQQHHPERMERLDRALRAFVESTRAGGDLVVLPLDDEAPSV